MMKTKFKLIHIKKIIIIQIIQNLKIKNRINVINFIQISKLGNKSLTILLKNKNNKIKLKILSRVKFKLNKNKIKFKIRVLI